MFKISEFLDMKYVKPEMIVKYREIVTNALAAVDDNDMAEAQLDFYQAECKKINEKLITVQTEGSELCYPGYSVSSITVYKDQDEKLFFGFEKGRAVYCAPETLAMMWTITALIQRQHAHNLTLYQGYDKYEDKFMELASTIDAIGGHIGFKRPVFEVAVPTECYSLTTKSYILHGVERDYKALENHLNRFTEMILLF